MIVNPKFKGEIEQNINLSSAEPAQGAVTVKIISWLHFNSFAAKFQTTSSAFVLNKLSIGKKLYVKLKDWMSNRVDPDETAHDHLDLGCLQKPIIIACGSESYNSFLTFCPISLPNQARPHSTLTHQNNKNERLNGGEGGSIIFFILFIHFYFYLFIYFFFYLFIFFLWIFFSFDVFSFYFTVYLNRRFILKISLFFS